MVGMAKLLRFLRGYLLVRAWGRSPERLMNLCVGRGMTLWNVSRMGEEYVFCISRKHFFRLRPLVRKTGVRVAILQRIGLPFFLPKMRKRWIFFAGAVLSLVFWLAASFFLWNIDLSGNERITRDQLRDFFDSQNVKLGIPLSSIDLSGLEKELRKTFPAVTWTSMTINGTTLRVFLKERDVPEPEPAHPPSDGRDFTSPFDGTIIYVIVRSGVPKVKIGDHVEKGQLLVEGRVPIFMEDGTVREWEPVDADADIWVEHVMRMEDCVPFLYVKNLATGRERKSLRWIIGDQEFTWKGGNTFYRETVLETLVTPKWMQALGIPIKIWKQTHRECHLTLCKIPEMEGIGQLEEKISRFLATLTEKGVQIIEKNVKIGIEGSYGILNGEITVWEKVDREYEE